MSIFRENYHFSPYYIITCLQGPLSWSCLQFQRGDCSPKQPEEKNTNKEAYSPQLIKIDVLFWFWLDCTYNCLTAFFSDPVPLTVLKPLTWTAFSPSRETTLLHQFPLGQNLHCLVTMKGFLVDLAELFSINVFQGLLWNYWKIPQNVLWLQDVRSVR